MTSGRPAGVPLPLNRWDLLGGQVPAPLPRVSVIIVHFEQHRQLERTLAALSRQTYPHGLMEVIVVDDGSQAPPSVGPHVILIRQPDLGFRAAAARNRGAEAATGRVLIFLDADTSPEPDYVAELSRLPALAPDCVTVGRRRHARFEDALASDRVEEFGPRHELTEPPWLVDAYRRSDDLLQADDRSYRSIISSVLACNRTMFEAAGPFDETFTRYGGEDWEWADRAWLAGALFAHVRAAVAWHDGSDWSERESEDASDLIRADSRRARAKNAETIRLSALINAPGSAPRGIRQAAPAVVLVVADPAVSEAAEFVTIDSALADVPQAAVLSGRFATHLPSAVSRARYRVTFLRSCEIPKGALNDAIAEVADDALGSLTVSDADDSPVFIVASVRAAVREERWDEPLFPVRRRREERISPEVDEPDLERYLGGW
ncbi:hypothetical protein BH09ACT1_BH09ACT1_21630 [soil metagenome]